jgi:hypothetical protein
MYIDHYRQAQAAGMKFSEYLEEMGCTEGSNAWIRKQVQERPQARGSKPEPVNI